ncbi:hypothetical protein OROGR_018284 [Orobanche gracilis]
MASQFTPILKTLIFLIVIINLHRLTQSQSQPEGPSPSPPLVITPQQESDLTPQYRHFLQACERRLTLNCSEQIVEHVFGNGKAPHNCCSKLIGTGPDCHRALIDGESAFIGDYDSYIKTVTIRSEGLWKKCEKSVPTPRDGNYPRFPPRQYRPNYDEFLEKCAEKITEKCGAEVVNSVFMKEKKVGKGCCKKLLKMGRECHEELMKGLKNLGEREEGGMEMEAKSDRVWKHCKDIVKD